MSIDSATSRYLDLAKSSAACSSDPNTQVGCVIVNNLGPCPTLIFGYNRLPAGIATKSDYYQRPLKYAAIEHAERIAIFSAAREGVALQGSTIYITAPPCTECARAIIEAGISTVVFFSANDDLLSRWEESLRFAKGFLNEAGIKTVEVKP